MYLYEKTDYSKLSWLSSIKWDEYLKYQDVKLVWDRFKKKNSGGYWWLCSKKGVYKSGKVEEKDGSKSVDEEKIVV